MSLGAPTISIAGLADLDRLLKAADSDEDAPMNPCPLSSSAVVQLTVPTKPPASARDYPLDRPVLNGMTPTDLLQSASGPPADGSRRHVDPEEIGNDEC